jgi:hypothetical protein
MATLLATRGAQFTMEAEFAFNFDDTMKNTSGVAVDFGLLNTAATTFNVINLPMGAVVLSGSLTVETAFDAASYAVVVGDSAVANRYLATADRKAAGVTPLVPTGYKGDGENISIGITCADVCTAGRAVLRLTYITTGRINEQNPN